ncbi:MAG: peptidoglycan DD-metalloendopeptidase family protein [Acidimicrobiales bacterium]
MGRMSPVLAALALCVPVAPAVSLPGPVVRPFVAPECARCAGHRGVTVSVAGGRAVVTPFAGEVRFAGTVARRSFVVIDTGAGLLTVGDLASVRVSAGETVSVGRMLGESGGSVYVGVRRGGVPVDPRVLFGGSRARLVPPPSTTCPVGPAGPGR